MPCFHTLPKKGWGGHPTVKSEEGRQARRKRRGEKAAMSFLPGTYGPEPAAALQKGRRGFHFGAGLRYKWDEGHRRRGISTNG